jgi:serine/threonine-protein kinase
VSGFPARVGPYIVEKHLARGGMGALLVVRHEKLGARYALKFLEGSLSIEQQLRFAREIEALGALSGHPHIVGVHASGAEEGRAWYVMDLVEGASLDAIVAERGPLPIAAALRLGIHVARALEAAHARGILHRDMKPANILVVGDLGADGRAILCDFGLATLPGHSLTKTGEILGTPVFMAPEQAMGALKEQGPATDVWGLGAVLYFALTGRRPYTEGQSTAMGVLTAIVSQVIRPPRTLRREIPEALEGVILACLEKDLARRLGSATELRHSLEAILAGKQEDALARRRGTRSTLRLAGVAFALLLPVAVAVGVGAGLHSRASRAPAPPPPPDGPTLSAPLPTKPPAAPAGRDSANDPIKTRLDRLGDRIVDDADERESLTHALLATIKESPEDDVRNGGLLEKGLEAGLDLSQLLDSLESRCASVLPTDPPSTKLALRPIYLAVRSMRRPRESDRIGEPSLDFTRSAPVLKGGDLETFEEYADFDLRTTLRATAEEQLTVDRYRARHPESLDEAEREVEEIAKAHAELAGTESLLLARAQIQLSRKRPEEALKMLGAPLGESEHRQLLRAAAEAMTAEMTKDDEHEKKAVTIWSRFVPRSKPRDIAPHDYYLVLTAIEGLVRLEHRLGADARARAWYARGRYLLEKGDVLDALAEDLFPEEPRPAREPK